MHPQFFNNNGPFLLQSVLTSTLAHTHYTDLATLTYFDEHLTCTHTSQQIPGVSPTGRFTTAVPLFLILIAIAVKEIIEDVVSICSSCHYYFGVRFRSLFSELLQCNFWLVMFCFLPVSFIPMYILFYSLYHFVEKSQGGQSCQQKQGPRYVSLSLRVVGHVVAKEKNTFFTGVA